MARDLFLLVLALLTMVAGVALAIMILRRRRERAHAARRSGRARYGLARPSQQRRIDDFATPTAFDESIKKARDIDDDLGKICPRCGARYGSHHRFCEHDNSELAALN